MTGIGAPITTNQFIPQTDGRYKVEFTSAAIVGQFGTPDVGVIRCYRLDNGVYKQVLFYHEVTPDGDVSLYFDEPFAGKLVITTDM